jgi:hypothetical protein
LRFSYLVPVLGILEQSHADDLEDLLVLGIVSRGRVGQNLVISEGVLPLETLMDEEGSITTIIDNDIRTLTVFKGQGLKRAPPVLLQVLALPSKHWGTRSSNGSSSVVLGGEDVTGSPANLGTEITESLNEHSGLDGHVQRAGDAGTSQRLVSTFNAGVHESEMNIKEEEFRVQRSANCGRLCDPKKIIIKIKITHPGISISAREISLRPKSARDISLTLYLSLRSRRRVRVGMGSKATVVVCVVDMSRGTGNFETAIYNCSIFNPAKYTVNCATTLYNWIEVQSFGKSKNESNFVPRYFLIRGLPTVKPKTPSRSPWILLTTLTSPTLIDPMNKMTNRYP